MAAKATAQTVLNERDGAVKKFAEINKQLQGGEAEKTELVEMRKAAEVQCEAMALKCSRSEQVAQNGAESMLQLFGLLGMPARVATLAPASPDGDSDGAASSPPLWPGIEVGESDDGLGIVQITSIAADGAASRCDQLAEGDVLLAVDGEMVLREPCADVAARLNGLARQQGATLVVAPHEQVLEALAEDDSEDEDVEEAAGVGAETADGGEAAAAAEAGTVGRLERLTALDVGDTAARAVAVAVDTNAVTNTVFAVLLSSDTARCGMHVQVQASLVSVHDGGWHENAWDHNGRHGVITAINTATSICKLDFEVAGEGEGEAQAQGAELGPEPGLEPGPGLGTDAAGAGAADAGVEQGKSGLAACTWVPLGAVVYVPDRSVWKRWRATVTKQEMAGTPTGSPSKPTKPRGSGRAGEDGGSRLVPPGEDVSDLPMEETGRSRHFIDNEMQEKIRMAVSPIQPNF